MRNPDFSSHFANKNSFGNFYFKSDLPTLTCLGMLQWSEGTRHISGHLLIHGFILKIFFTCFNIAILKQVRLGKRSLCNWWNHRLTSLPTKLFEKIQPFWPVTFFSSWQNLSGLVCETLIRPVILKIGKAIVDSEFFSFC